MVATGKTTGRHISLSMAFLVATLAVVGCGRPAGGSAQSASAQAPRAEVAIQGFKFDPDRLNVRVGTTVRWTNRDSVLHTITSGDFSGAQNIPDGMVDGRLDNAGATFERTFDRPGAYTYFCRQHNVMNGTVNVS